MKNSAHPLWLLIAALLPALPSLAEQPPGTELIPQNAPAAPQGQAPVDIFDIYGPLPLPDPVDWLPYIIAVILLLLVASVLLFFFLKKKKTTLVPAIPAHITALSELELAREYLVNNQSLIYAERISEILRRYIEQRFNIGSTRQTTSEFLDSIQDKASSVGSNLAAHRDQLCKCMQQCDMAKFAHKTADKGRMEEMEDGVRRFIDSTTPTEDNN
jgi:hypothetical protein